MFERLLVSVKHAKLCIHLGHNAKGSNMSQCKKCFRPVHDCSSCNGGRASGLAGKLTCSKCNNTGSQCNEHGGFWK